MIRLRLFSAMSREVQIVTDQEKLLPIDQQPMALIAAKLDFLTSRMEELGLHVVTPLKEDNANVFVNAAPSAKGQEVRQQLVPDWSQAKPILHTQQTARIGEIVEALQTRTLPKLAEIKAVLEREVTRRKESRSAKQAEIADKIHTLARQYGLSAEKYMQIMQQKFIEYYGEEEPKSRIETPSKEAGEQAEQEKKRKQFINRLDALEFLLSEAPFDEQGVLQMNQERQEELVGTKGNPGELSIMLGAFAGGRFAGKYPHREQAYLSLRTLPAIIADHVSSQKIVLDRENVLWEQAKAYTGKATDKEVQHELERRIEILFGKQPTVEASPSPAPIDPREPKPATPAALRRPLPPWQADWLRHHESPITHDDIGDTLGDLFKMREKGERLDRFEEVVLTFYERLREELQGKERRSGNRNVILYQDEDLFIIDKPAGINSHYQKMNPVGVLEVVRYLMGPTISLVHRLDRDTSGVLVFARNQEAFISMSNQFGNKERSGIKKVYAALVDGDFTNYHSQKATIVNNRMQFVVPLTEDGTAMRVVRPNEPQYPSVRKSVTYVQPVGRFLMGDKFHTASLLEVEIVTGMTHQIRVLLADFLGLPIKGDRLYNPGEEGRPSRMMLHAWKLRFNHPRTGEEMEVEASARNAFHSVLSTMTLIR